MKSNLKEIYYFPYIPNGNSIVSISLDGFPYGNSIFSISLDGVLYRQFILLKTVILKSFQHI